MARLSPPVGSLDARGLSPGDAAIPCWRPLVTAKARWNLSGGSLATVMFKRSLSALGKSLIAGSLSVLPGRTGTFARRWLAWEFLRGDAETITFQRDGFTWSVFTRDIVGRSLYIRGDFQLDGLQPLLTW